MLENFLRTHWGKFIGTPLPDVIQVVPLTSCVQEYGNDLILIFTDQCTYPTYIMKISRSPLYSFKLEKEFSSLHSLRRIGSLQSFIPTPYHIGNLAQNTFFIQKGIPGSILSKLIGLHGLNTTNQQLLNEAVNILVAINTAPVVDSPRQVLDNYEASGDTLQLFEKEYIAAGISKKTLEELREYRKRLTEHRPRFFLHGDYWPTNLIVNTHSNRIAGIIDWEFSEPDAFLPTDIILFMIKIGRLLALKRNLDISPLESYKWTFFTEGEHTGLLKSYYQQYMKKMGLDEHVFIKLLELTLAEMAMREIKAYGKHWHMDYFYLEMFRYTLEHRSDMSGQFKTR